MRVMVARTAGFCKGVKSALEVTMEAIQKRKEGENLCTYGPLIHNRQVLAMLEEKGVRAENDLALCAGRNVVIRAHGIPPHERQELHRMGAALLDATCTRVARVHGIIKRHARRGFHTIIAGDADHAEVIGLMGYTEGRGVVINRAEQVDDLPSEWEKVLLVAQTTQNEELFRQIQERFLNKYPGGVVKNTICGSTHERQAEVRQLCGQVEAMVIVGGFHSGNTVRLAEIARQSGIPTFHVETEANLDRQKMAQYALVGVSAGASTPNWIIRNVVKFLESVEPGESGTHKPWKWALEGLTYSNVIMAFGAALLPFVAQALAGLRISLSAGVMAACYAFAMHSLNIYLDGDAIRLNDPKRAAFYQRWRFVFTGSSVLAVALALWMALERGALTFLVLVVMVMLGILYAVPVVLPARWRRLSAFKIKDIPTSKTFSVPIAWACVAVLLPHLSDLSASTGELLYAWWIVFLLVLVRTLLLDFLAFQGDKLVGKETLVVLVGEARTAPIVTGLFVLLGLSVFFGPVLGLSGPFAVVMLAALAGAAWHLRPLLRKGLKDDLVSEALVESMVIGCGLLGLAWKVLIG